MVSSSQIRQDLKNIRYYYSRKAVFDNAIGTVGEINIVDVVAKYNKAIQKATPRLYDLYLTLYVENNTQDSLSEKWGYCIEHMSRMNAQLVRFLQKQFEKEEKNEA